MQLNWNPVIISFLQSLVSNGYTLLATDNGDGWETAGDTLEKVADELASVDESWLRIEKENRFVTVFLVIGNAPSELVCDYSGPTGGMAEIERVIEEWSATWEDKDCPVLAA